MCSTKRSYNQTKWQSLVQFGIKKGNKKARQTSKTRRSNNDFNINKYKKQRHRVNNLKKHAKEQFYFNVNTLLDDFSSSNSKSYWSLIKKLVKSSGDISPITQLKKENNDLISDDYEKACLLNK